jgi:hypothetical protein
MDSPNKSRDPRKSAGDPGVSEPEMLVRYRMRLQHRAVRRFILRHRPGTGASEGGVLQWLARRMRIRIPAQSFRAVGALVMAAVIVGPITLTVVAAHDAGFGFALDKIQRFTLPIGGAAAPGVVALQGEPPVIRAERASDPATLTAGNILPADSAILPELGKRSAADKLFGIAAASTVADSSAPAVEGSQAASSAGPEGSASSSGWPLAPSRQRLEQKLRAGYLWRAWMEKAAQFHAKRTHGKSLLIYHPGEGYAVLSAAYRPMIQPVKPSEESEEDRSVYQDRRQPRLAPGEPVGEVEASDVPPVAKHRRGSSGGSSDSGGFGRSFQPWDADIISNPFGSANAAASRIPGLRIDRVVLFQGFSTNAYTSRAVNIPFFNQNLGYDVDLGAMATISWTRARPTSSLFMVYTPSHFRRMRYSDWNSTDHQLSFGANKNYRRWSIGVNSDNGVRGLPEVLFTPAVTRTVPDAPGNFDDLLQALEGGQQLSSDEIASVLTGAPVIESQPKTRFDQGRVLAASLRTSVSYAATPRLSTGFSVGASHYQTLSRPEVEENVVGLNSVERATSGSIDGGLDYKLSPELSAGVNSSVRRSFSTFGESTAVNTSGTLNKRLGRRWSVNGGAGVGTVTTSRAGVVDALASTRSSWIVNGGLQYTGREHSLNVSGSRSLGDSVGIGAQVSYNAGAQWQWARTGTPWGLYSRANWYQLSLDGFGSTHGTYLGAGLMRQLSRETSFQAEYSYQTFQSPFRGVVSNLSGHRLQMSWMWRPAGQPR